jgi:hypothetical protein
MPYSRIILISFGGPEELTLDTVDALPEPASGVISGNKTSRSRANPWQSSIGPATAARATRRFRKKRRQLSFGPR